MRTDRMEPWEPELPKCPVCGEDCRTFYLDFTSEIIGCNRCIRDVDSFVWMEREQW